MIHVWGIPFAAFPLIYKVMSIPPDVRWALFIDQATRDIRDRSEILSLARSL
jgi:hypothetical protein